MSRTSRVAALLLLSVAIGPVATAAGTFTPSIALVGTYVDNIDLAPPGAPKSGDWLGQVVPRVQLEYMGPRLTGMLDYSAQLLYFRDRSELNSTHHNGAASGSWTAEPDLFYVDGSASYSQQVIDPTQPRNTENLFSVGNTADQLDASLSPYLKHDFGDTTGLLRYSASGTRYFRVPDGNTALLQDSFSTVVTGQYASNDASAPFAWSLDGRSAHTTFEAAEPFRADRISANGSLGVVDSLRLVAAAGAETNILENSDKGGLNAGFWSAGFKWAPNPRSSLEARVGHRFFGNAYSFSWLHQTRLLELASSYTEEPTTDVTANTLIEFVPGSNIQPQAYTAVPRSSATYSPYVRKQFDFSVTLHGRRTVIALRGYHLRREFTDPLLLGVSDTTEGGDLTFTRNISDRTKLEMAARVGVAHELRGIDFRDQRYSLGYTHLLGSSLSFIIEGVQLRRTGGAEYVANIASIKLLKTF